MLLTLQRSTLSPATLGQLSIDGLPECDTLELPWEGNRTGISCIPPGRYRLAWEVSPRLGRSTLRVKAVPDRFGILIHPANRPDQLKGCIALGKRLTPENIRDSRKAVEAVEAKVKAALARGEEAWIEISNPVIA
jgi:hypothetical protein